MSVSNDVTDTAHIRPHILYVGLDIKQYVHWRAGIYQKVFDKNKHGDNGGGRDTYLFRKRKKRRNVMLGFKISQ